MPCSHPLTSQLQSVAGAHLPTVGVLCVMLSSCWRGLSLPQEANGTDTSGDQLEITLRSSGLGDSGWMGIGWGGLTMATAQVRLLLLLMLHGSLPLLRSQSTREPLRVYAWMNIPPPGLLDKYAIFV